MSLYNRVEEALKIELEIRGITLDGYDFEKIVHYAWNNANRFCRAMNDDEMRDYVRGYVQVLTFSPKFEGYM